MFILFQDRYLVFKFFERKFSSLGCHVTCANEEIRRSDICQTLHFYVQSCKELIEDSLYASMINAIKNGM